MSLSWDNIKELEGTWIEKYEINHAEIENLFLRAKTKISI